MPRGAPAFWRWLRPRARRAKPPADALGASREAFRTGRYNDAIGQARRAAEKDTDQRGKRSGPCQALAITGKYAEAEDALTRFTTVHPRNVELLTQLGGVQRQRGRLTEAQTTFARAVPGRARDS